MSKETKEKKVTKILNYLMTGGKITVYQATLWFGYTDLRKLMCDFEKELHLPTGSAYVEGKNYKQYWINIDQLAA